MLKRIEGHGLGESISRRVSYHCTADYAKSSRARCRECDKNIEQNELRLALMLQDEEGYKNTAWMHFDCFWKHPETSNLDGTHEIHNFDKLNPRDRTKISTAFEKLIVNKVTKKRKGKALAETADDGDSEDEDFKLNAKSATKKKVNKRSASNKRKRGLEEE